MNFCTQDQEKLLESHAEELRLKVLKSYGVLDTPPESDFDRLTHLASLICKAPIAVISLIDRDRYWCKSAIGLTQIENDRAVAFCDHTIRDNALLMVSDASQDPRFSSNPFVASEAGVRFYAGMPLISPNGFALGALAILDMVPRVLTQEQTETLKILAAQVVSLLELRRLHLLKAKQAEILERVVAEAPLPEVLNAIIEMVESHEPKFKCSILLLDHDGKRLRHGSAPSLPSTYTDAIDGVEIGPSVGSCGTAAFQRQAVIAADIATDPRWNDYRELALSHNLHSCWSIPVFSAAKAVLGTFATYSSSPCQPNDKDLELVTSCSHIVSLAVERLRATQSLQRQAALLDKAQDAIVVHELDGRVHYWNKGAERLLGWKQEEVVGKQMLHMIDPTSCDVERLQHTLLSQGEWQGEMSMQHKNGNWITVDSRKTLVVDEERKLPLVFSITTDITERKEAEKKIHHLAFYDQLTRLPNRLIMLDRLKHAQSLSARTKHYGAVMFIDLDDFKSLNDTLGHHYGDLLLQQVSDRLVGCVRESDTVARFGGDEFVLILEELSGSQPESATRAEAIAKKVLATLTEPYCIEGKIHSRTASIGLVLFNGTQPGAEELLKHADFAMYQAKSSGRNAIRFFDPEMQEKVNARIVMERDMGLGLGNNEFFLAYQPQVDHAGAVVGVEALLRWKHPRLGLISPMEFIPVAEDSGLILPLGEQVLEMAMSQLRDWAQQPETAALTVAINVSARQLHQPEFVHRVLSIIDRTGAPAHLLKIELTESMLVKNVEEVESKMEELKTRGVSFSLDDFGTGYSSLSYLTRFPFEQLKIDQSFVANALVDSHSAEIVSTIIALARTLGMVVIAEGVESKEQHRFLENLGCKMFQGYLFNGPLSADQLNTWMVARQNSDHDLLL